MRRLVSSQILEDATNLRSVSASGMEMKCCGKRLPISQPATPTAGGGNPSQVESVRNGACYLFPPMAAQPVSMSTPCLQGLARRRSQSFSGPMHASRFDVEGNRTTQANVPSRPLTLRSQSRPSVRIDDSSRTRFERSNFASSRATAGTRLDAECRPPVAGFPRGSGGVKQKDTTLDVFHNKLHEAAQQLEQERAYGKMLMERVKALEVEKMDALTRAHNVKQQLQELKTQWDVAQQQFIEKETEVRILHEKVFDLKGRTRLCIRVRPLLAGETYSAISHIKFINWNCVEVVHEGSTFKCECEHFWTEADSQVDVFLEVVDFVRSALYGYNVAIIAYGQTGSGKTFTIRGGDGELAGIFPRTFELLFRAITDLGAAGWMIKMTLSVFEIYLGRCFDLLDEQGCRPFDLHFVGGRADFRELTALPICSVEEAMEGIQRSDKLRLRGKTISSDFSSRGHTIIRIQINTTMPYQNKKCSSHISLVDLAGSERVSESGVTGERLQETSYINKSLNQLGIVLRAQLAQSIHVPYMNDILTKVLADSLGADSSRTMFIANISPNPEAAYETRRTIQFINQAMKASISGAAAIRR